ncbi:MAG: hypothetical protein GF317_17685 [Candidatus Lokiarchaeota archaeon]|nr:hypothetical protein [Candidatus Lokiarchaeota archaeon]MBD3201346.1 hypothetical protein [Candidatus Lokiarchaeota archaeon]
MLEKIQHFIKKLKSRITTIDPSRSNFVSDIKTWIDGIDEKKLSLKEKKVIFGILHKYEKGFQRFEQTYDFLVIKELHESFYEYQRKFAEIDLSSTIEWTRNLILHFTKELDYFQPRKYKPHIKFNSIALFFSNLIQKSMLFRRSSKFEVFKMLYLILSAFVVGSTLYWYFFEIHTNFHADIMVADVGEKIEFEWFPRGAHAGSIILFGDGNSHTIENTSSRISHQYSTQGIYTPTLYVWNRFGVIDSKSLNIKIKNNPPDFDIFIPKSAEEDENVNIQIKNVRDSSVDLNEKKIKYICNFGDNTQNTTTKKQIFHKWTHEGTYPLTITLIDDQGAISQKTKYIEITNRKPEAQFCYTIENQDTDREIYVFNASLSRDSESDLTKLNYIWKFGNEVKFGKYLRYAFGFSGRHKVELCVIDDDGVSDQFAQIIYVEHASSEQIPQQASPESLEILGPPFPLITLEGQSIPLEIEVYDQFEWQMDFQYTWKDSEGRLFSEQAKPLMTLDDGVYEYRVDLSNRRGGYDSKNISVYVENIAPTVLISNYYFNGINSDPLDYSEKNTLTLCAYGYDSHLDSNELTYKWMITNGRKTWNYIDEHAGIASQYRFECHETTIYKGIVEVFDSSGKKGFQSFEIFSFIDNNLNGMPNEFEDNLAITGESVSNFNDVDNDHLSDKFEILHSTTDYSTADYDNDGLYDGFDQSGIGELFLGTDPNCSDTDMDELLDGFEFFGWNISVSTREGSKQYHVSSNPLLSDSDGDGLSDSEEYNIGTHPGVRDTDGDGLLDNRDMDPLKYDMDEDMISDKMELYYGTDYNNSDTDGDGLKDGVEIFKLGSSGFATNPLNCDSDDDFLVDSAELKSYRIALENEEKEEIRIDFSTPACLHFPYLFETAATAEINIALTFGESSENQGESQGQYGITDEDIPELRLRVRHEGHGITLFDHTTNNTRYFSKSIDISEIMNNRSFNYNYYGNYILEINESSPECIIEQFELQFTRYLDPNDNDFDDDGIYDGVEAEALVKGIKVIDVVHVYNESERSVLSTENKSDYCFTLEIPQLGKVFDANLCFKIESDQLISSATSIYISISKTPYFHNDQKYVLYSSKHIAEVNSPFELEKSLNLTLMQNEIGDEPFSGKYTLHIKLNSSTSQNLFTLSSYYIDTLTYRHAYLNEQYAWITDPARSDSDNDGWEDYYEIFVSETSPINKDTDGDNALDPLDRDPLHNVILEINPIYADFANYEPLFETPELQLGFHIELYDRTVLCHTPVHTADRLTQNIFGSFTRLIGHQFEEKYYLDIEDDLSLQPGTINITFTSWHIDSTYGGIQLVSLDSQYNIDGEDNNQSYFGYRLGEWGIDQLYASVNNKVIKKANTIAVYDPNTSEFHLHYQNPGRMNIIQLYINNEVAFENTPFTEGANVIVVPTSLFSKTKLNGLIQHEKLEETTLYSEVEEEFEFYSIDRNGEILENGTSESDFVFIRHNINVHEAMEILDLVLICILNESEDVSGEISYETETFYTYISTKLNATSASSMNLPHVAMGFIPWFNPYESSEAGPVPPSYNPVGYFLVIGWIVLNIITLGILALISCIATSIAAISSQNNDIADKFGFTILSFLGHLLWLVVRAALIVFAYICLALELVITSAIFLGIGASFSLLGLMSEISCDWGLNWAVPYGINTKIAYLNVEMMGNFFKVETWIHWIYWEFFDMYFPTPNIDLQIDDILNQKRKEPEKPSLHCGYTQLGDRNSLLFNFETTYNDLNGDPPEFVVLHLISPIGEDLSYEMTNQSQIDTKNIINIGITYNISIDFSDKEPGQWFYYFETEEKSNISSTARWPVEYAYEPGPYISPSLIPEDTLSYFFFRDVTPQVDYVSQKFKFLASGVDFIENKIPKNVFLNILFPNRSLVSFQMDLGYSYNITDLDDSNALSTLTFRQYEIELNFSELVDIDDQFIARSFYSATFSDGTEEIYFDNYETKYYNPKLNLTAKKWFTTPLIMKEGLKRKPNIIGWSIEESPTATRYNNNNPFQKPIGPLFSGTTLRFFVFISDPDGTHKEIFRDHNYTIEPTLHFTNLDDPSKSVEVPMVWGGNGFDPYPEVDAYYVDVCPRGFYTHNSINFESFDFSPGAWKFAFQVEDHTGEIVFSEAKCQGRIQKIWYIGNAQKIWDVSLNGYTSTENAFETLIPGSGVWISIITSIAYITSGFLCNAGEKGRMIARVIATGIAIFDLVNVMVGIIMLLNSGDTDILLGLSISSLISVAGLAISYALSNLREGSIFSKIASLLSMTGTILSLINFLLMFYCNPALLLPDDVRNNQDWDMPGEDLIKAVPIPIISYLISVISLGFVLNIASGNHPLQSGKNPISPILKFHIITKLMFGFLCLALFSVKVGMRHVIGDYLRNLG